MVIISKINKLQLIRKNVNIFNNYSTKIGATKHYDIIIAGGGMVGTTLACLLGKNNILSNKRILLLEAGKNKPYFLPENYNNRVVSINPANQKLFNEIGAWEFIKQARTAKVESLQVWDALSDSFITFGGDDEDHNAENVSYIVENDLILAAVLEQLNNRSNVEIRYEAKIKNVHLPEYEKNTAKITLANNEEESFTCDLLLGCDGVNSSIRKAMHADYISWSYHQMGVVATVKFTEKFKNSIAWQRFLPNGPVALLPLNEELSSLVWSTTVEEAKKLLQLSEDEFVEELNSAIFSNRFDRSNLVLQANNLMENLIRLGNCTKSRQNTPPPRIKAVFPNSRAIFPLGFGHSSQYIGKCVALVGDAAHRIHPLAGQGVNLGFGDVALLNKILTRAVYAGSPLNNLSYLKEYESERQKHNLTIMLAVEGLYQLYHTDFVPVVLLRSLGLQFTNALEPLKKMIMMLPAI